MAGKVHDAGLLSFAQEDLVVNGAAIEIRINAERLPNFAPCPGKITQYHVPGGLGVRMDSALYDGYSIPPYYDSLIGKLIVHGRDRREALARLHRALGELIVDGGDDLRLPVAVDIGRAGRSDLILVCAHVDDGRIAEAGVGGGGNPRAGHKLLHCGVEVIEDLPQLLQHDPLR